MMLNERSSIRKNLTYLFLSPTKPSMQYKQKGTSHCWCPYFFKKVFKTKNFEYKSCNELPLFLNAETVAKVLGISSSSKDEIVFRLHMSESTVKPHKEGSQSLSALLRTPLALIWTISVPTTLNYFSQQLPSPTWTAGRICLKTRSYHCSSGRLRREDKSANQMELLPIVNECYERQIWEYMKFHTDETNYSVIAKGAKVPRRTVAKHYEMIQKILDQ